MQRTLISLCVLVCLNLTAQAAPVAPAKAMGIDAKTTTQLPRGVWPLHYDVALAPDAQGLRFDGTTTVRLHVEQPTTTLTLHAADLQFSSVQLMDAKGKALLGKAQVQVNDKDQTATFSFEKPLAKGDYRLQMVYSGTIGTQANGLFALDYDSAEGKQRALYTQFENSDARRMIPSWDEPGYKASFSLEATVPHAHMAVSNMPVLERKDAGNGLDRVRFGTTPRMSTYLLFLGVGDFERATVQAGKTEVGVITKRGSLSQAQSVLDASVTLLAEYNDYFGVPYPLPKLDNVAAPGRSQFFGAMENWGAIFSFEQSILLDPNTSGPRERQRVFQVAAHEIAHQWFGNLVTMTWWDDLWLNEGFARWMDSRTTHRLHPEWKTDVNAVVEREGAMFADGLKSTHPVVQHIDTVEQASQAFDGITYGKGQAVIQMLENYMGDSKWREGVRRYMKKHALGNTTSDDLWREMDAVAGQPISTMALTFTRQPGIPLIRVEDAQCKNGRTTLSLSQAEFSIDQPNKTPLRWQVPVVAKALGSTQAGRTVVRDGTGSVTVEGCGPVVLNAGQAGYYRTAYSAALLQGLTKSFAELDAKDQLGLMGDGWALSRAGLQPVGHYLDLVNATPLTASAQVWDAIAKNLGGLSFWYQDNAAQRAQYDQFVISKLSPLMQRLGWTAATNEPDPIGLLRQELIRSLGTLGDPTVVAEARRRFAVRQSDANALPGALRDSILMVVAFHSDEATWNALHHEAKSETSPMLKNHWYRLLGQAKDKALARKALELALTDEVNATSKAVMISAVAYEHPDMAFDFAMAHLSDVEKMVDSTAVRFFPRLAQRSTDPQMVNKLKAYADQHVPVTSHSSTEQAINSITVRLHSMQLLRPQIDAWLASHRS